MVVFFSTTPCGQSQFPYQIDLLTENSIPIPWVSPSSSNSNSPGTSNWAIKLYIESRNSKGSGNVDFSLNYSKIYRFLSCEGVRMRVGEICISEPFAFFHSHATRLFDSPVEINSNLMNESFSSVNQSVQFLIGAPKPVDFLYGVENGGVVLSTEGPAYFRQGGLC